MCPTGGGALEYIDRAGAHCARFVIERRADCERVAGDRDGAPKLLVGRAGRLDPLIERPGVRIPREYIDRPGVVVFVGSADNGATLGDVDVATEACEILQRTNFELLRPAAL